VIEEDLRPVDVAVRRFVAWTREDLEIYVRMLQDEIRNFNFAIAKRSGELEQALWALERRLRK
jgi:hypothetical protein